MIGALRVNQSTVTRKTKSSIILTSIKSRKCQITRCRPTYGTIRKRYRTITATWPREDNQSKANRSIFLSNMVANLEKTRSTPSRTKCNFHTQTMVAAINIEQQNHHLITDTSRSHYGSFKCILLALNLLLLYHTKMFSSYGDFQTFKMHASSQRDNINKSTYHYGTKKG